MSISSEITRISNAKTAIAESIANKGVTVPDGTKIDGMATLIDSIPTGGGGGNDEVYEITITEDDIVYDTGETPMDIVTINISLDVYNYIKTNTPSVLKISDGVTVYYFRIAQFLPGASVTDDIVYWGTSGLENESSPRSFSLSGNPGVGKWSLDSGSTYATVCYYDVATQIANDTQTIVPSTTAVYNAIRALFTYDETTKTLNITPIGGGS